MQHLRYFQKNPKQIKINKTAKKKYYYLLLKFFWYITPISKNYAIYMKK